MKNPYLWLALAGLAIKLWATYRLRQEWKPSPEAVMCSLLLVLSLSLTVVELCGYYVLIQAPETNVVPLMKGYYALFSANLISLPMFAYVITRQRYGPLIIAINLSVTLVLAYLIVFTGTVIADVTRLEYTYTRVAGEYYWVFQGLSITAIFVILHIAYSGYSQGKDEIQRVKSMNLFIGFAPYALFIVGVIVLMKLGVVVNAAGIGPLLLAIFTLVFAENARRNELHDLRAYVPWTRKAKMIRAISRPIRTVNLSPNACKELPKQYNDTLVKLAEEMFDKQKDAAVWLGISESTMSRMKTRAKAE